MFKVVTMGDYTVSRLYTLLCQGPFVHKNVNDCVVYMLTQGCLLLALLSKTANRNLRNTASVLYSAKCTQM